MRTRSMARVQRWLLAFAAVVSSCGTIQKRNLETPESHESHFVTDRHTYTLTTTSPEAIIIVTYKNPHPFTVYFRVCGQKNIHEDPPAVGTKPVSEIASVTTGEDSDLGLEWACLYAPRRAVAPAGVLVDSVPIHRASARRAKSGPHRVVYEVYDRPSSSERDAVGLLSIAARRTNIFRIDIYAPGS